jgi:UDP-2,3-diacylglucosamine hydrolase
VFYVMGNHDNLRPFADRLSDLASAADNFQWHRSHVRIGDALFAHGDRFFVDRSGNPFSRQLAPVVRKRHGAFSRGYRLLHRLRVHKWHAPVYPHWRCVKRIARMLRRAAHPDAAGVRHVYFGHTHRPFTDYRHDGVTFHNTGSAIAGLRWNMLPVEIEPAVESLPTAAG